MNSFQKDELDMLRESDQVIEIPFAELPEGEEVDQMKALKAQPGNYKNKKIVGSLYAISTN